MPDFNAKMHQNRFRLGLLPRPRWGAYNAPPDPLAGFKGAYFLGEGRVGEGEGREGRGGERRGVKGRGGGGGWVGGLEGPPFVKS